MNVVSPGSKFRLGQRVRLTAGYITRLSKHGNGICLKGHIGIVFEIDCMETGYFYKVRLILSDPDRGHHAKKLEQWFSEDELEAIANEWGTERI